jgi:predicted ATPase
MTMKALKGSAIADHFADNAVEDYKTLGFEITPIKKYCQ